MNTQKEELERIKENERKKEANHVYQSRQRPQLDKKNEGQNIKNTQNSNKKVDASKKDYQRYNGMSAQEVEAKYKMVMADLDRNKNDVNSQNVVSKHIEKHSQNQQADQQPKVSKEQVKPEIPRPGQQKTQRSRPTISNSNKQEVLKERNFMKQAQLSQQKVGM